VRDDDQRQLLAGDSAVFGAAKVIERSFTSPTGAVQGDHTAARIAGEPASAGAAIKRNPAARTTVPVRQKADMRRSLKMRIHHSSQGLGLFIRSEIARAEVLAFSKHEAKGLEFCVIVARKDRI